MFSETHTSRSGLQTYAAHTRTRTGRVLQNRQLRIVEIPAGKPNDMTFCSSRLRPVPDRFRGKQVTPSTDVYLGKHADEASRPTNSVGPDPSRCYYDNSESFYTRASLPSSEDTAGTMWRTYPAKAYIPRDKTGKNASRSSLEESSLVDFVSLAHDNLTGLSSTVSAGARDTETRQLLSDMQLYELGILYDTPDDNAASPYQAAGLGSIPHAEPLYSVRHVTAKPRRGPHSRSAAIPAPLQV
ncbi:hypothetical protein F503_03301 [Ophiostoma piceae UAMH 11346]|uniref:Uncharacterized protein n=1 Tax=Ophiostoma piceae (strain UAMH 11346) TaxID=1262450 RepID=S3C014_OPHP1|nr:hypothetical protein F503_03301 [Ophiostoma piceae UAMH 11346]